MSNRHVARALLAAAALAGAAPASAQLYGASPFQNQFYSFDPDTFALLSTQPVTLAGRTVAGITGVTIDPTTGTSYAIVRATGVTGRLLVTINPVTAVATEVGNLGDNFSSITFDATGQMFGVTGDGATTPETLFLVNKATAATTLARTLGNGADGEVIAFDFADGNLYHWSGNGTVVFERVQAVPPYTVTNIPITGTTNGEIFGASWDACRNQFITSNIGSRFQIVDPNGTFGAQVGPTSPDDIRGHALVGGNTCNADLATTVSVAPAAPTAGSPVTFTITVTNNGPARARAPALAIAVPANVTGAATTGCAEDPAGTPTCTLPGTLFTGASATVTVTGTYTGGTAILRATASTTSSDTVAGNNTAVGVIGPLFTVTPTSGLVTTEAGGTATFTVALNAQPSANVTIGVSSSDTTEGTVAPATLTFTPANFATPQQVTLTGVDDALDDGNVAYSAVLAPAASADPAYNGADPPDVSASNTDNDTSSIQVSTTGPLRTTESGGTATFTVVLGAQPTANVTIPVSSSDTTEGTVSPASLVFTPANWNVPQTVTVTGVDDGIDDNDIAYTVVLAPATSADPAYAGLNAPDVSVVNGDNDATLIAVPTVSPGGLVLLGLATLLIAAFARRRAH
jgi:hypothetical protein